MKIKYLEALMDMTVRFGETSSATRLKVGAMIFKNDSIIALGVNGQPSGWSTECCEGVDGQTLPTVRHAESAALEKLWNSSETAKGSTMFISHAPCINCAIKIKTSGISSVYYRNTYRDEDGLKYLMENNIEVEQIKD